MINPLKICKKKNRCHIKECAAIFKMFCCGLINCIFICSLTPTYSVICSRSPSRFRITGRLSFEVNKTAGQAAAACYRKSDQDLQVEAVPGIIR